MLKWIGFLILLGISVAIFVFAPMGLVGYFISRFTPAGLEWVGVAFAIGLSLSIVSNSFLARWKSMRLALWSLVVLALSEGAMSGGTLYLKAVSDSTLDLVVGIGIIGIVAMQEAVLISGGIGLSLVLKQIESELDRAHQKQERKQRSRQSSPRNDETPSVTTNDAQLSQPEATIPTTVATVARPMTRTERLDAIRRVNTTRNGDGPLTPEQIAATYGVSLRQAQRDVALLAKVV